MYSQSFADTPAEVAKTLRRLHKNNDVERFGFVDELADELADMNPDAPQIRSFCISGLPIAIMDILSEPEMYSRGTSDPYQGLEAYTVALYKSLLPLCRFLCNLSGPASEEYQSCIAQLLQKAPKLWGLLWKKRTLIYHDDGLSWTDEEEEGLRGLVAILITQFIPYYYKPGCDRMHSLSDRMAHVLLYCWMLHEHRTFSEFTGESLVILLSNRPDSDLAWFIREVITNTGSTKRLVRRFCEVLNDQTITDTTLWTTLVLLRMIIKNCPELGNIQCNDNDNEGTLLASICVACQRQMCTGLKEEEEFPIVEQGFTCIGLLLDHATGPEHPVCVELGLAAGTLKLIPLAARTIVPALHRGAVHHVETIDRILSIYSHIMSMYPNQENPIASALTQQSRRYWLPTVKAFRELRITTDDPRIHVQNLWLDFGHEVGLNEHTSNHGSGDAAPHAFKRCYWHECLCFGSRPSHPVRVCRGCWSVFYCSPKCQRNDWVKGGHKTVCRRRSLSDQ